MQSQNTQTFFDLSAKDIDGNVVNFEIFRKAKAIVVVNVACKCGLTKDHYNQLVEMYEKYKSQGLEVLGFPCNQFASEEPQPENEIKEYVKSTFGVQFQMFSKIEVNGENTHEVYVWLKRNSSLLNEMDGSVQDISWNFGKFLIDSEGKVAGYFSPDVEAKDILPNVLQLLNIK